MFYVLAILWHERQRFLPGVLAVAFSALLIALQCGLLLGMFAVTSIPVDRSSADIWVSAPHVQGVDLGRPISLHCFSRLASTKGIENPEPYMQGFNYWIKPQGGSQLCMLIAGRLEDDGISMVRLVPRELRQQLTEPGTVVIDKSDMARLGIAKVGDTADVLGHKVRVIGFVEGLPSFAGPYVFCSLRTARPLLHVTGEQTTFILARCQNAHAAEEVVERLRGFGDMEVFTTGEFSYRTRMHWLMTTKAGIALGYTAVLGLLVGAVVTSQTLYSATASSFREYATLEALGIPRYRIALMILSQAWWIGIAGVVLALPVTVALAALAELLQVHVLLPALLLGSAGAVTLLMAMLAGLAALRSLRFINVYSLLR